MHGIQLLLLEAAYRYTYTQVTLLLASYGTKVEAILKGQLSLGFTEFFEFFYVLSAHYIALLRAI
jgi:hypothetical protein